MPLVNLVSSFWRNRFRRERVDQDLEQEVHAYLDLLIEEKIHAGMSRAEATHAARIELGGIQQVKEEVRDIRTGALLSGLLQDVHYGTRTLFRNPGFAIVSILALALGIGANTAIFSIVYGVLLRPLPFPHEDRLATLFMHFSPQNAEHGTLSIADYLDWKTQNHAFEDPALFRHAGYRFDITGTGDPEQVAGTFVTAKFFSVLQVKPLIGRVFEAGEDRPTAARVAIIGESLWHRHFGSNPAVIGRSIRLNGAGHTVVGIMPAAFNFPPTSEVWTNLRLVPPTWRGPFPFIGLGRLKAGVTMQQAQRETNAIGRDIERHWSYYQHLSLPMVTVHDFLVGEVKPALLAMSGAVLFLLLIAVVNVANLLLARATVREREMALRASLGAGSARLMRQVLTESTLLALTGGLAGLALAWIAIHVLQATNPGNLPRIQDVRLDARVLGFTFVVSLITGGLFGAWPAMRASRGDVNSVLKEGGRTGTSSASHRRTHGALVVCEIALSFMLLAGAGLLLRSFLSLQHVNAGFHAEPQQLLSMTISPPRNRYNKAETVIAFYQRLVERIRALPGVESAAVSDSLPPNRQADYDTFQIEGQSLPAGQSNPAITDSNIGPEYFSALGVPLIRGRFFTERDTANSPQVAIVSETFARNFLGGRDPVGGHMKASGTPDNPLLEIVGVAGDVKYTGLEKDSAAAYYLPYTQNYAQRMYLIVRSPIAPNLAPEVRRAIRIIDREVAVTEIGTLQQAMFQSVSEPRFRTVLIAAFAGLALLLSAIGIYGVIAYSVVQRTNEIGLRMALGAQRTSVLKQIVGSGAILALAGVAIGCFGALALTRLLSSLLFATRSTDPLTFVSAAIILTGVAFLASLLPALRATRIDPIVALRYE
ncbi:MAG: ADOP family duplicated permease [Bryobacteraceae bacterium]